MHDSYHYNEGKLTMLFSTRKSMHLIWVKKEETALTRRPIKVLKINSGIRILCCYVATHIEKSHCNKFTVNVNVCVQKPHYTSIKQTHKLKRPD